MTDIPIIFSAPMIRAFLDGRKTMTRRLAWALRAPPKRELDAAARQGFAGVVKKTVSSPWQRVKVGDRLWVKESVLFWIDRDTNKPAKVAAWRADGYELEERERWTTSIHMPRWASRLTLIIEATKVEPLQAISEEDARAEGVEPMRAGIGSDGKPIRTYRTGFVSVWGQIHGEESWLSNPEVVALTVRVIKANIDELSPPHKTHTAALAGGV